MKKAAVSAGLAVVLSVVSANIAYAVTNTNTCTSVDYDSYSCVSWSGYVGEDGYNVDRFSTIAVDGTKHSCTSFAAYMLYHENTHYSQITYFDSAQYWAIDAAALSGVIVSRNAHVGDIAQWNSNSNLPYGHVAVVIDITYTSTGTIAYITTADDNSNLKIASEKRLYPGNTTGIGWPSNFITFPGFTGIFTNQISGGSGGKPPVALVVSPVTN